MKDDNNDMARLLAAHPHLSTPPAPNLHDARRAARLDEKAGRHGRTGLAGLVLNALTEAHHKGGTRS